jgi:isoquinoline 1-oxidoreductase beta subunit
MRAVLENVSRKGFIDGAAAIGALVVGMRLIPRGDAATPPVAPATDQPYFNPTEFIAIDQTGLVTIIAPEIGQGIRTGLPMVVADELEADWSRVRVSQGVGDEAVYGGQNTDGSRSMRHFFQAMRQMGAAVRQMLEAAAAASWGVDVSQVYARNHQIIHTTTRQVVGYGELAAVARALKAPRPEALKLKPRSDFRDIGKGLMVDLTDMTTSRAGHGIDVRLPGIKRSPRTSR